ncbi:MAG: A24 family peptidase, partial [Nanoarchaeota archaeon]
MVLFDAMSIPLNHALLLLALVVAAVHDIRTREVPDWLSYAVIAVGLASSAIYSIVFAQWTFIVSSLFGLGIGVGLGCIMYYAGQWGGGDAKLMMGVGAMVGLPIWIWSSLSRTVLVTFLLDAIVVGAVYGLVWSIALAVMHWRRFSEAYGQVISLSPVRWARWPVNVVALVVVSLMVLSVAGVVLLSLQQAFLLLLLGALFLVFHMYVLVK